MADVPADAAAELDATTHLLAAARHFGEAVLQLQEENGRLHTENDELHERFTQKIWQAYDRGSTDGRIAVLGNPEGAMQLTLDQATEPLQARIDTLTAIATELVDAYDQPLDVEHLGELLPRARAVIAGGES